MVNFCRKFIPNLTEIDFPLTDVFQGQKKNLSEEELSTFNLVKENLADIIDLTFPNHEAELYLTVDGPRFAIETVLQ